MAFGSRISPHLLARSAFSSSFVRSTNRSFVTPRFVRAFGSSGSRSQLFVDLTAPNGITYKQPRGLFINNEFVASKSGETVSTISPFDEKEITSVYAADKADVDDAVVAARKALNDPSWKDLPATDRGMLMFRLADLIDEHRDTLAAIETWDNGKTLGFATADIVNAASTIRYYAGWADKVFGKVIPTHPGKLAYTMRQPIGVVGQIIPWNFPLLMAAWKLGPALAGGNTIIMKPSEQTPLSVLYLSQLIREVGIPPGVFNLVSGFGATAGDALASHPNIDKIAFTGSTHVGRSIMKIASEHMKNITLETGGKSPLIVFSDANLEQAVRWSHQGIMQNQGQTCCATSRLLIHEDIYDKFVEEYLKTTTQISVIGNPFDSNTFQGPQISKAQQEKVLAYAKIGTEEGATLVTGGETPPNRSEGWFVEPTIFSDVKPNMRVFQEEVFGPFVAITKFKTQEEAVRISNDCAYGLGAAVFTSDIPRAHKIAADLEAGMVWINSSNDIDYRVAFGGVKQSGIGRELGEYGLDAYTQVKAVHVNLTSQ